MTTPRTRTAWAALLLAALHLAPLKGTGQHNPTPPDERMKSLRKKREAELNSSLKDIPFRNIGPSIMGGRVVDIEVNPARPSEFYVAYATGGLWHTRNNGQSLEPVFETEDVIGIGDIAVNWKTRDIWVGTGEANSSRSSYAGLGIYRSSDSGRTWSHGGLPGSRHIGRIQLHPTDPLTAWVAVLGALYTPGDERGVYKTTDGGKSWRRTLFVGPTTGIVDLEVQPGRPQLLYACAWQRSRSASNFEEGGRNSGIYRSTDGGETWERISGPETGFPQGDGIGRIGIATSPAAPGRLYALLDNYNRRSDTTARDTARLPLDAFKDISGDALLALPDAKLDRFLAANGLRPRYSAAILKEQVRAGTLDPAALYRYLHQEDGAPGAAQIHGAEVYRSDDGGRQWKKTHDKPLTLYNTYGYYFGRIVASPVNPDKIVILGFSADVSTDGGKTFRVMDKANTHADWHACWINPTDDSHMVTGNDGGANVTYDNGQNWFKVHTPSVGQFYAISTDQAKPYNVYGGLQDNGSWYGPSNHKEGIDWLDRGQYAFRPLNGGDGMQVQVDPRDNNTVYTGLQFGSYFRYDKASLTMKPIRPTAPPLSEDRLRFNWQTPILLSPHNPDILYIGSQRLHRSMNRGESFETLSADLTGGKRPGDVPYGTLTSISESPLAFGLVYTGSDDGHVHVTRDGGASWARLGMPDKKGRGGLPQGLWVSRILASRHQKGRVYLTLNGYRLDHHDAYVYRSEDYGQTWTRIGTDLPLEPVNVIREDPTSDSILYVGTDGGAFASLDGGNHFMPFVKGLPRSIPVHDIAIQERDGEIVLGTHGRSLYVARLEEVRKRKTSK